MTSTYNEKTELAVIASVIQGGVETYNLIEGIVKLGSFWWKPFDVIWKSFENIKNSQNGIDKITVMTELSRGGGIDRVVLSSGVSGNDAIEFLSTYSEINISNAESYASDLVEATANRKLEALAEKINMSVKSGISSIKILSDMDVESGKISTIAGAKLNTITTAKDAMKESLEAIIKGINGGGLFIPTGLSFIDDYVGGLGEERVVMVAGGTGSGKSAMGASIINKVCIESKRPIMMGWITLEMSKRECINRIIANHTNIPVLRLEQGKITEEERSKIEKVTPLIVNAPVMFEDNPELNYFQLKTKIRKMKELGCKSILIDQLSLITPLPEWGNSEYVQYNKGSYKLKSFAREFHINIIVLHQIKKDADTGQNRGKNVEMNATDVQSGGQHGADAIGIIRHYENQSFLNWVKNRIGIKERQEVIFDGQRQRFEDSSSSLPEFMRQIPQDVMEEAEPLLEETPI